MSGKVSAHSNHWQVWGRPVDVFRKIGSTCDLIRAKTILSACRFEAKQRDDRVSARNRAYGGARVIHKAKSNRHDGRVIAWARKFRK